MGPCLREHKVKQKCSIFSLLQQFLQFIRISQNQNVSGRYILKVKPIIYKVSEGICQKFSKEGDSQENILCLIAQVWSFQENFSFSFFLKLSHFQISFLKKRHLCT